MILTFHCGWCGTDIVTDDFTICYKEGREAQYWKRCPNCGDLIMQEAQEPPVIEIKNKDFAGKDD